MSGLKFALTFGMVALSCNLISAQHYTARFFTSYGSDRKISDLQFAPNSKLLAVAVEDGPLTIIDLATGDVSREFKLNPFTIAWAADSTQLLAMTDKTTMFVDASSGATSEVNWRIPAGYVGLTFKSQAGKLVVAALTAGGPAEETNQIHVGDELVGFISNGKQQSLLGRSVEDANRELGGPAGTMITVRTVPKGSSKTLETSMRRKFGKMEGGKFLFRDVSASTSPQACLAMAQQSVIILDANSGNVLSMIKPVDVRLGGICGLSQDGKRLACVSNRTEKRNDGQPHGLEVFDVERQERTHFATLELENASDLRFSPDGQRVLIGESDRIIVYDLQEKEFAAPILVGFDPANAPEKKKERSPISVAPSLGFGESSTVRSSKRLLGSYDVSPDGKIVAVGTCDGQCALWSTERHEQLATFGEKQENFQMVAHTAYSQNGQWIAYFCEGTLTLDAVKDQLENSKPQAQ